MHSDPAPRTHDRALQFDFIADVVQTDDESHRPGVTQHPNIEATGITRSVDHQIGTADLVELLSQIR